MERIHTRLKLLCLVVLFLFTQLPSTASAVQCSEVKKLYAWYSHSLKDSITTTDSAWGGSWGDTVEPDYNFSGVMGYVYASQKLSTVPLFSWYSESKKDHLLSADPSWRGTPGDVKDGYHFVRHEGFAHLQPIQDESLVALENFFSPANNDSFVTSEHRPSSPPSGYRHIRTESYIFKECENSSATRTEVRTKKLQLPYTRSQKDVRFELKDGIAVIEGDIVLGKYSELDRLYNSDVIRAEEINNVVEAGDDIGAITAPLNVTNMRNKLWPGCTIPFTFGPSISTAERGSITAAIANVNTNSALTLRPALPVDVDRVIFRKIEDTCASPIGRQGGTQAITVDPLAPTDGVPEMLGCSTGAIMHEILHTAGVWHEVSRSDRDEFIIINRRNIQPRAGINFDKNIDASMAITPYDVQSIMHYTSTAFSIDGTSTTISSRTTSRVPTNQRQTLSPLDIQGLALLCRNAGPSLPALGSARIIEVTLNRIRALSIDSCDADMEYRAFISLAAGVNWPGTPTFVGAIETRGAVLNFAKAAALPPNRRMVTVHIRFTESDDILCGGEDDNVDLNPAMGGEAGVVLVVDTSSGLVFRGDIVAGQVEFNSGLLMGAVGSPIRTFGGSADVFGEAAALTFTVTVR